MQWGCGKWNNGVEWFLQHFMMRHGIRGTTVMSSGQACELLAHQDHIVLYGFSQMAVAELQSSVQY